MDTPSELLSAKILDRLVDEKLLSAPDGKKLLARMAAGKLRPEDWRLPIEMAGEKEAKK
jgi:hypothetical protein